MGFGPRLIPIGTEPPPGRKLELDPTGSATHNAAEEKAKSAQIHGELEPLLPQTPEKREESPQLALTCPGGMDKKLVQVGIGL